VQSDAVSFDGIAERGLFDQVSGPLFRLSFMFRQTGSNQCAE